MSEHGWSIPRARAKLLRIAADLIADESFEGEARALIHAATAGYAGRGYADEHGFRGILSALLSWGDDDIDPVVAEVYGASAQPTERPASKIGEFTAERVHDMWTLRGRELDGGITVHSEQLTYPLGGGAVAHIKWGETCPPRPIEVRLERKGGA